MGVVEVYVVRIYRRHRDDPHRIDGIVERPARGDSFPFSDRAGLLEVLFEESTPEQKVPKSEKRKS